MPKSGSDIYLSEILTIREPCLFAILLLFIRNHCDISTLTQNSLFCPFILFVCIVSFRFVSFRSFRFLSFRFVLFLGPSRPN